MEAVECADLKNRLSTYGQVIEVVVGVRPTNSQDPTIAVMAAVAADTIDKAMRAAGSVKEPATQARAYAAIAEMAVQACLSNKANAAIDAAKASLQHAHDDEALARVAKAAAAARRITDAMALVTQINDTFMRNRAFGVVARKAAANGLWDAALKAAEQDSDVDSRSEAYENVTWEAACQDQIEIARRAERMISPALLDLKSAAQRAIAAALARSGSWKSFYDARVRCEPCEQLDKLKAYTVILQEYTKRYPPKRHPQGELGLPVATGH
jgi:hypothetical protein